MTLVEQMGLRLVHVRRGVAGSARPRAESHKYTLSVSPAAAMPERVPAIARG